MTNTPASPHRLRALPPPTRSGRRLPLARLPVPLAPLVGRECEAALAMSLLRRDDVQLLTLTGPGGVGKTRLAIKVAADLRDAFAAGVQFVPLAAVPDAGLVAATIAHAFGLVEAGGVPVRDTLVNALRDAELLLVLDNVEHLLTAAPLLTDLLAACPRLKILTTSRALLRLAGEQALPVPPLDLPDPNAAQSLAHLARSAAVRLFVSRAQSVAPSFDLTETTAPLVADICRRLDGLPLAIELSAAQIGVLPPAALLAQIEARLPLPFAGPRDAPARQRTLRDAIAWSYDLLPLAEQALFRRLSVFVGGFTLDGVERVMGDGSWVMGDGDADHSSPSPITHHPSPSSVLDLLASLVDKSLVSLSTQHSGAPSGHGTRYTMLETIREFAAERLAASGEDGATHRAHTALFLSFAEQRAPAPFLPDDGHRLAELAAEDANLHAALAWLAAHGEAAELARLVAALGWSWLVRGHLQDGRAWFERALARADPVPAAVRARIAIAFGLSLLVQGDHRRAGHWVQESLALARGVGDALGATQALVGLGVVATAEGEYDRATAHFEEALALARSVDDPRLTTALASAALANLGVAARGQGRLAAAAASHEAALVGQRELGYVRGEAQSLLDLGEVAREQGELARAFASQRESLLLAWEHGETRVVVEALEGFACTVVRAERAVAAARLFAAAERLRELTGFTQRFPPDRARYEWAVAAARAILGESAFAAAWAAGRALPLERAVAEALDFAVAPAMPPPGPLSPREIEVLRLLVTGQPDREIAEALFLSVRTVENHVARILAKLGVRTRTAAVTAAIAAGLVAPDAPTQSAPPG